MSKKQLQTGVKDSIEYGLEVGYFKKVDNAVYINPDSKMSFHEFNFMYNQYLK